MPLRIQLGSEDLGNVRFADAPAPLLEATLAVSQHRRDSMSRRAAGSRREPFLGVPASTYPLFSLIREGRGPKFLDPLVDDPAWGLELVRSVPAALIRNELSRLWARPTKPPLWLRNLADGDASERQVIEKALRIWYQVNVAPRIDQISRDFHHDIEQRTPVLRRAGIATLLNRIHPGMTYRDGVVELPHPLDLNIKPDGQGFELMPTASWLGAPLWTSSLSGPTRHALIYPAQRDSARPLAATSEQVLARLLGPTRAMILTALGQPRSTGELARLIDVSAPTASQHATVLRAAGLIASCRNGQSVMHSLTPLGATLLRRAR